MAEHVLGIDLGTSNSVVAVVQEGVPQVIADADGRTVHPSVVSFHPSGSMLVGAEGKRRILLDPKNTITSIKRLIGRVFDDAATQDFLTRSSFEVRKGKNEQPIILTREGEWEVPEVSALVLHHMKLLAERHLRSKVSKLVLTCPANFNDAQRAATKASGEIAGYEVLRIINEPTAAALAYGHGKRLDRRVLVYDFGGGTFDATILEIHGDMYEVQSTAGNTFLGGDDMDEQLVRFMSELFLARHQYDLTHNETAMHRLRSVAQQVKHQLTVQERSFVQVKEIAHTGGGKPLDLEFAINRDQFEKLIDYLVDGTFAICDEVLRLARMKPKDIDEVILVGGTTRVPLVRNRVEEYFGKVPLGNINPDEVVAIGAAVQGASLLRAKQPPAPPPARKPGAKPPPPPVNALLMDVTPLSLGIAVAGGFTTVLIERNSPVPSSQKKIFTTSSDNQTWVNIRICQGEQRKFDENTALGEVQLSGLRAAPRGHTKVEVTFQLDTNGLLRVSAKDPQTGQAQQAAMKVLGMIAQEDIPRAKRRHELAASQLNLPVQD